MTAHPEPDESPLFLSEKSAIIRTDSNGPSVSCNFLEMERWMTGVITPNPIGLPGARPYVGGEVLICLPEPLVCAAFQGRRRVLPALKSVLASSMSRRRRPFGRASSTIWLSHKRLWYSVSHSARRLTSAAGSFSISASISSTLRIIKRYVNSKPPTSQILSEEEYLRGRRAKEPLPGTLGIAALPTPPYIVILSRTGSRLP
jgi:hypothetical protein